MKKNSLGDKIEIREFNEMIDNIVESISSNEKISNPLKESKETLLDEVSVEIKETVLEKSEKEVSGDSSLVVSLDDLKSLVTEDFIISSFLTFPRRDKLGVLFIYKDMKFISLGFNIPYVAKEMGCHTTTVRNNTENYDGKDLILKPGEFKVIRCSLKYLGYED
jgi:hypothetical protein